MKKIPDIETLISDLRPAGVSRSLRERIAADLDMDEQWMKPEAVPAIRPQQKLWWQPMTWSAIGAAAAVVAMLVMPARNAPQSEVATQATQSKPPAPSNELSGSDGFTRRRQAQLSVTHGTS